MQYTLSLLLLLAFGNDQVSSYTGQLPSSFIPKTFQSSFVHKPKAPWQSMISAPFQYLSTSTSRKAASSSMVMLVETSGGMEELQEMTEQADSILLSKQVRKSPSLFKIAGYASIPLSAALGFGIVPSRRFAAHTVGAVITGIAGAVGKSRLDALTEESAKPALAQVIVDNGLEDPEATATAIENVKTMFGLLDEDYAILATEIYASYLVGMIKYAPTPKTSELKELKSLKTALTLDNLQVGEAHAVAADVWYQGVLRTTSEEELQDDPDHPDRQAMDKLLFLSERAFRQGGETDGAFTFEMTRVAKNLGLSLGTAMDRVAGTVEPFYHRALKSTRSKLGTQQVSSTMLERARRTLGVDDDTAADLHVAAYNEEVRSLLGLLTEGEEPEEPEERDLATVKFPENAVERLDQLQEILGLTDTDAAYEIASEATPLYQATASKSMEDVLAKTKTPDDAWKILKARGDELLLNDDSVKTLVASMVMQALGVPLEKANKFAKVNNEAATFDNLLEALEAKETLIAILKKSGWDEFDKFDEIFCNPWDKKSANGFLLSDERIRMYRIFLTRSVRKATDGKLTDEIYARIQAVGGLLGVTDQQAEIEARSAFGPELQKVLDVATTEIVNDSTPELVANMEKKLKDVIENYHLSDGLLRELGATFYSKAVEQVSKSSPGGIPTMDQSNALSSLRKLFHLAEEETYSSHSEFFGSIYKKSVLEAMGTTGVIRPEFREALDDLSSRLGVAEHICQKLFMEAVEEKMIPMVEWIGNEMERTMLTQKQRAQRKGKDLGEDLFQTGKGASGVLGLGAEVNIMGDIMELIDFYRENDIITKEKVGTETVERTVAPEVEGGEPEVVADEVPVFETVYPVTALGTNAIDQEMAELLYRQFIVSSFTTQGEQASRYEEARETFAGILGLSKETAAKVSGNIGDTVYDNLVSNAMKTKGAMDQQDLMFLANLQSKLGLSDEQAEKMLMQSQKKVLVAEIEALMDNPSPTGIKAFREKCNSMGMSLLDDVGISGQRLSRMFELEITPGLKSGEITADNSDILGEIQESLGIEAEECETMFESTLMQLSKNAMDLIKGELLRGREDNTVDLIKEIARYAAFTEGDLGLNVEEAIGNQILNVYESLDLSDLDTEMVKENTELLRVAVGLSS